MRRVFKGKEQITACPECGGTEFGVVVTFGGKGMSVYNLADGSVGDNTGLHDNVVYREQKKAFCADCKTPLGMVKDA